MGGVDVGTQGVLVGGVRLCGALIQLPATGKEIYINAKQKEEYVNPTQRVQSRLRSNLANYPVTAAAESIV